MANKPFDREIINVRERPFSSDINLSEYYADLSLRETIKNIITSRTSISDPNPNVSTTARFLGSSFKVVPTSPESGAVLISKGLGFVGSSDQEININSVLGLNETSELKPLVLSANKLVNVPQLSDPLFSRIDIIEVRSEYLTTDSTSRDIFDPVNGTFNPTPVAKTLTWALDQSLGYVDSSDNSTTAIGYKKGQPIITIGGPPNAPEVTQGYTKIAEVFVSGGGSAYSATNIVDCRKIASEYGIVKISGKIELPNLMVTDETDLAVLQPTLIEVSSPPGVIVSTRIVSAVVDAGDATAGSKKTYEIVVVGNFDIAKFSYSLTGNYEKRLLNNIIQPKTYALEALTDNIGNVRRIAYQTDGSPIIVVNGSQQCAILQFVCQDEVGRIVTGSYSPPTVTDPAIVDFFVELS
jgi:hypothetical protein